MSVSGAAPHVELCCKKVGDGHPLRLWRATTDIEAPPQEVMQRFDYDFLFRIITMWTKMDFHRIISILGFSANDTFGTIHWWNVVSLSDSAQTLKCISTFALPALICHLEIIVYYGKPPTLSLSYSRVVPMVSDSTYILHIILAKNYVELQSFGPVVAAATLCSDFFIYTLQHWIHFIVIFLRKKIEK